MPIPEYQLLLDDEQATATLNISAADLNQLANDDILRPISIHGKLRFLAREIQTLILSRADSGSPLQASPGL